MSENGTVRFNLFRFATSELSHSALLAWLFQSLDTDADWARGPRNVAERFLESLGIPPLRRPVEVQREFPLPGGGGRLDVVVRDDSDVVLVVENKVKVIPDANQLSRYSDSFKSHGQHIWPVIVSTAFDDDVRKDNLGWKYRGLEAVADLVRPDRDLHPLLGDYSAWLDYTLERRARLGRDSMSSEVHLMEKALETPEGQWKLMESLTSGFVGEQCRGVNKGGFPWTQFWFRDGGDCEDGLFYRIDRKASGFYFSVRQYQSQPFPSVAAKLKRLIRLRGLWSDACAKAGPSLKLQLPGGRGTKESEIACLLLRENVPTDLKRCLSGVHDAFVSTLHVPLEV